MRYRKLSVLLAPVLFVLIFLFAPQIVRAYQRRLRGAR